MVKTNMKSLRTAAVTSPRPFAVGETLNGASPHQSVSSIAPHLTAGPQRAPVGHSSGGAAGRLPVGQTRRMTPVRV